MAVLYCFRVRWAYVDGGGKLLKQWPEQEADFVVTAQAGIADGATRPDGDDLRTNRIPNNFPTPAGASVVLLGVSSSQTSAIYL